MQSVGWAVESCTSGAQLFELLKKVTPDCLILDLHMPHMTGFDVLARLTQEGSTLPVVTITAAYETPESQQRVLSAGAAAYLRKPVAEKVLLDAVTSAIKSSQSP